MSNAAFKAVIFDLDGTLLDTIEDLGNAMNRMLERHGLPVHPVSSYRYFVGNGAKKLVERALPDNDRTPVVMDQCLREFIDHYRLNWDVHTAPYPGILPLLDELHSQGIRMAILSNKIHDFTRKCVERFLPMEKFEVVAGEKAGIPRKPDPSGAMHIAEEMGLAPAEILYVGDTATDMKTGAGAGMVIVGVLWGFRDRDELERNGADYIIERPEQLFEIISR